MAALSDDLALPLLQVKSTLEQLNGQLNPDNLKQHIEVMSLSTETGLRLVEAYSLILRSEESRISELNPLAIGAVLEDVAHLLTPYAKQYDTVIEVDVQGRLSPVLVHQPSLSAALEVLSASLIRAQTAQDRQSKYRLLLGAHRSDDNAIAAGVFSNVQGLSDRTLRAARGLTGRARQPLTPVPSGAASGVLIADMLCTHMWQPLRSAAHRNMGGLATMIPTTSQLNFV